MSRDRSALAVRDLSVNPRRKRTTAPNYDPTKPTIPRYRLGGFGAGHARDCPQNPTVRGRIRLLRRGENHRAALMPCRKATLKDCRVALRRALPNLPDHLYREHPRRQAAASSTGNRHRETWAREGASLGAMLALRVMMFDYEAAVTRRLCDVVALTYTDRASTIAKYGREHGADGQ